MKRPLEIPAPEKRPSEYFAKNVFNQKKMWKYLPADVYQKLREVIEQGTTLDMQTADEIAKGMKRWAMEMGATHITHWFQPLTEGTAEKHDAFVEHDGKGGMIENFSGQLLVQQEPDASSFPNGGIRSTFEARGYSAWDPASPVFIVGDTLMIPTVFISYTGEALDYKAPLKKSIKAVGKAALDVARMFYPEISSVKSNLGWEQEYFLVDESFYSARPDLAMTGRTLMGHDSAKNQQMDDHYFGSIPSRVVSFMKDLEIQALELGIPCKTRHNEVAPNQFELVPIFEEMNLAIDHNMLIMALMKKVARKHGFRCLLHEKPFKGINGSGKHNNWSLSTNTGILLHAPGKTPVDNLRFITFIVETLMAVYRHNGLLKASIVSATNAHRLGAHEAPPAIISSFLGSQLAEILEKLETCEDDDVFNLSTRQSVMLDIPQIPELLVDNTDRNRTSPFAFTGNRFEFRAAGSSANCAASMIVINAAMAHQLNEFKAQIDALVAEGMEQEEALYKVLKETIIASKNIRFEGDGYSDEWKEEALNRGLTNICHVPEAIMKFNDPQSRSVLIGENIFNDNELKCRIEVELEKYTKKVQIESRILGDLAINHIVPTAVIYQNRLLENLRGLRETFSAEEYEMLGADRREHVKEIQLHILEIKKLVYEMTEARKISNHLESEIKKAYSYQEMVSPYLEKIREHIDHLELEIDDEIWPLPKYRELLFTK